MVFIHLSNQAQMKGKTPRGRRGALIGEVGMNTPILKKKSEVQRGMATCLRAHSSYPEADLGGLLSELKRSGEHRSECVG